MNGLSGLSAVAQEAGGLVSAVDQLQIAQLGHLVLSWALVPMQCRPSRPSSWQTENMPASE